MSSNEEMTGRYKKQIYFNSGNNFVIGKLDDETAVKGNASNGALIEGLTYTFFGKWVDDPKWGRQFHFNSAVEKTPLDYHGVSKYLQMKCTGIGPITARQLCDTFGAENAVATLKHRPEVAASAIRSLTTEIAVEASKVLKAFEATEYTDIELLTLLQGRGFSAELRQQAIKKWGVNAPNVIKRNPYTLLVHRLNSAGWHRCDQLYLDLGHNPNALKRQMLCIFYAIRSGMEGSTWHSYSKLRDVLSQSINGPIDCDRAIELGCRAHWLVEHREITARDGKRFLSRWVAERREHESEDDVARWVLAANSDESFVEIETPLDDQSNVLEDEFSGI